MFKVPLKITYAIQATLELAMKYGSAPIQARVIAKRQDIPVRFIEQILHALKHAGIVESLRGAQGGYSLRKNPTQTSLAEIVEAMNGPINPPAIPIEDNGHSQPRIPHEILLSSIWHQVHQAKRDVLDSITLDTLVERYGKLEQEHTLMYHI